MPLAEHARAQGINERTLRRQMTRLHARLGGGVLHSYNLPGTRVRKWWLNLAAVRHGLGQDPTDMEEVVGELMLQLEELKKKAEGLRQAHISLKGNVKKLESRLGT